MSDYAAIEEVQMELVIKSFMLQVINFTVV